jgi:hypothetical protein
MWHFLLKKYAYRIAQIISSLEDVGKKNTQLKANYWSFSDKLIKCSALIANWDSQVSLI